MPNGIAYTISILTAVRFRKWEKDWGGARSLLNCTLTIKIVQAFQLQSYLQTHEQDEA